MPKLRNEKTGPTFSDIPQFPRAGYSIDVVWYHIEEFLADGADRHGIELEPDFQRGHVWSEKQQTSFVEYGLMGGESSMVITANCPGWMDDFRGPYQLVDGLQRVTAVMRFMRNEIKAFGHYYKQYADRLTLSGPSFRWRVMSLPSRAEVLKLYLLMNAGGVVHSPKEIARVRALLTEACKSELAKAPRVVRAVRPLKA